MINNIGKNNGMWKGDDVGYYSLHEWIRKHKPKPELCEECGKAKPYDVANISGEYKRDINDFRWLCRSCHMKKDGRSENLSKFSKNRPKLFNKREYYEKNKKKFNQYNRDYYQKNKEKWNVYKINQNQSLLSRDSKIKLENKNGN